MVALVASRLTAPAVVALATILLAVSPATPGSAAGLSGRIAVVSGASGNDEIVSIAADGTTPITLTTDAHPDSDPAYSPDGTRIAFARQVDGGTYALWTMRADGSGAAPLTPAGVSARHPNWSPDGAHIVFDRASVTTGRDLWAL